MTASSLQAQLAELMSLPAEQRCGELRARIESDGIDYESRLLELIEEAAKLTMASTEKALEATAVVQALAQAGGTPLARARASRARARALAYAGRFDEALVECSEAIGFARQAGRFEEEGRARLASMHALTEMGRLDEAIAAGQQARETFMVIGHADDVTEDGGALRTLAARADCNLGIVFQRRDQPEAAVVCFERAMPYLQNDPVALGHVENSRGEALLALNDFAAAQVAFSAALAAFDSAGATLTAAIAEGNLADLAVRRGQLQAAMEGFERARRRFEEAKSPGHLARLLAEQAEAMALIGLTDEAMNQFERALEALDRCGLPLEAARTRAAAGLASLKAGRTGMAETMLAAAATAYEKLQHVTSQARVDLLRAELAASEGRHSHARRLAQGALAVLEERPVDCAEARHLMARLALQRGELDVAEAELSLAQPTAESLDLAPMLAELCHTRAKIRSARNDVTGAAAELESAVGHIERVRGSLHAERFRTAWLAQRVSLHEELIEALLASGASADRLFRAIEQCKARSLLDLSAREQFDSNSDVISTGDEPNDSAVTADRERLLELQAELNALYSRFADENFLGRSAADLAQWRGRLTQRERELAEIETRIASRAGPAEQIGRVASLRDVQGALREGEVLLQCFMSCRRLVLMAVISSDIAVHVGDEDDCAGVEQCLRQLQFQVDRALRPGALEGSRAGKLCEDAQRPLAALYDVLLRPVRDVIEPANRLLFAAHGILHTVPLHALYDGRRHVVETAEVSHLPSASLLVCSQSGNHEGPRSLGGLVVGVPDDYAPQIRQEATAIAQSRGWKLLLDDEATVDRIRQEASRHDVLHLACHGQFTAETPLSSGLRLADGWLTLGSISRLSLRAKLVTLSACETGLGAAQPGDELLSVQRAFLAANAGAVLTSLWRAQDEITAEFMCIFYDTWHTSSDDSARGVRPKTAAAALRHTCNKLREAWPHPALWGAFTLAGIEG